MSWSFSVNEANKDDARRVFENQVAESTHIPDGVKNSLTNAAAEFVQDAKPGQPCVLSTNGHINADGTGSFSIQVLIKTAVETLPGDTSTTEIREDEELSNPR